MNKKMAIYPTSPCIMPVVRHSNLFGYDISALIAPKGFGYDGKDVGFVDGGSDLGIVVTSEISDEVYQCDAIYIDFNDYLKEQQYIQLVENFRNRGIKVWADRRMKSILKRFENEIEYIGGNAVDIDLNSHLSMVNIPTILVLGAGEQTDKFDIQLLLREYFLSKGHRILQFGSKDYSSLFGFKPLPDFLYADVSFEKKILLLSSYLHGKVTEEKPDILILGVPGGVSRASLNDPKHFGELALVISNAVNPDIAVMSLYNDDYHQEDLSDYALRLKLSLNIPSVYYHISNKKFLFDFENGGRELEFLTKYEIECNCDGDWFNVHDGRKYKVMDKLYAELTDAKTVVR